MCHSSYAASYPHTFSAPHSWVQTNSWILSLSSRLEQLHHPEPLKTPCRWKGSEPIRLSLRKSPSTLWHIDSGSSRICLQVDVHQSSAVQRASWETEGPKKLVQSMRLMCSPAAVSTSLFSPLSLFLWFAHKLGTAKSCWIKARSWVDGTLSTPKAAMPPLSSVIWTQTVEDGLWVGWRDGSFYNPTAIFIKALNDSTKIATKRKKSIKDRKNT